MNDLCKYADKNNKTIILTPSNEFGATSKKRLVDFYKRFGFVENKGKNKIFGIFESMYRLPKINNLKEDSMNTEDFLEINKNNSNFSIKNYLEAKQKIKETIIQKKYLIENKVNINI